MEENLFFKIKSKSFTNKEMKENLTEFKNIGNAYLKVFSRGKESELIQKALENMFEDYLKTISKKEYGQKPKKRSGKRSRKRTSKRTGKRKSRSGGAAMSTLEVPRYGAIIYLLYDFLLKKK